MINKIHRPSPKRRNWSYRTELLGYFNGSGHLNGDCFKNGKSMKLRTPVWRVPYGVGGCEGHGVG